MSFFSHTFLVAYSPNSSVMMIQAHLSTLRMASVICVFALTIDNSGLYIIVRQVCWLCEECLFVSPNVEKMTLKIILIHSKSKPKLLTHNVLYMSYSKPGIYLW